MALQSSGEIRLSEINAELGRSSGTQISLDSAENGSIVPLNNCSLFKPSATNPSSISEWYAYNHTQPCIVPYCAGYSNVSISEACSNTADCITTPVFNSHDYIIMRVNWTTGAGSDLDILFSFINTGQVSVDNDGIGYNQGDKAVPGGSTVTNSFTYWNGDNTGAVGPEAASVNFTRLMTIYPGITANPIRYRMNAWWYNTIGTGDITIEFLAYSGGAPQAGNGYNMVPGAGSVLVDYIKVNRNVSTLRTGSNTISFANSTTLGYLNYNPTTKKATFSVN